MKISTHDLSGCVQDHVSGTDENKTCLEKENQPASIFGGYGCTEWYFWVTDENTGKTVYGCRQGKARMCVIYLTVSSAKLLQYNIHGEIHSIRTDDPKGGG